MILEPEIIAKFKKKYLIDDEGCWLWIGPIQSTGYGRFNYFWKGKEYIHGAHRYSYVYAKGPIEDGAHIHHTCENTWCVNPDHLESLSSSEHKLSHLKETCPNGHPYSGHNLIRDSDGYRLCRICRDNKNRKYYYKY